MYATAAKHLCVSLPASERARYDDAGNRVSDIVRSCPIRIYHRLLRHSPDYLATRCKPVRNRLGEFIGRPCVGLWKTATADIMSDCRNVRARKGETLEIIPKLPYLLSRWNEPRERVGRRHEQASRYNKEFLDLTVRSSKFLFLLSYYRV